MTVRRPLAAPAARLVSLMADQARLWALARNGDTPGEQHARRQALADAGPDWDAQHVGPGGAA